MTPEILWIPFGIFSKLITSIESNVPHKIITYKHCFPWVTHNLRKLINKKNKAYNNRKKHPGKFEKFKNDVSCDDTSLGHYRNDSQYLRYRRG